MEPTYQPGTTVTYDPSRISPSVGEVVVFREPTEAEEGVCGDEKRPNEPCQNAVAGFAPGLVVGRVVGTAGESLTFHEGVTVRNGQLQSEPFAKSCSERLCSFSAPITVPQGSYYILFDNRSELRDSRVWGAVPQAGIVGTVIGVK